MTSDLTPDCARCAALCCVFLEIDKGPKFALQKRAGVPCPNLARHACKIHERLTESGFPGCVQYSCHGAGQIVVQQIFGGQSWRDRPELAAPMAEAFRLLREVQDLRLQVIAARSLSDSPQIAKACDALEQSLTPDWSATELEQFDIAAARSGYAALLELLRQTLAAPSPASGSLGSVHEQ